MKDLHEDNIIGSVRERLGRYEEAPSEALWGKIATQRERRSGWVVWVEAVCIVGMGVMIGMLSFNDVMNESVAVFEKPVIQNNEIRKAVVVEEQATERTTQKTEEATTIEVLVPGNATVEATIAEIEIEQPETKPEPQATPETVASATIPPLQKTKKQIPALPVRHSFIIISEDHSWGERRNHHPGL